MYIKTKKDFLKTKKKNSSKKKVALQQKYEKYLKSKVLYKKAKEKKKELVSRIQID